MKKTDVIATLLGEKQNNKPVHTIVKAFAPTNVALCKYWGKRNRELNLPVTSSLSISLGKKGATVELKISDTGGDVITLNHEPIDSSSSFYKRVFEFLNLFFEQRNFYFDIHAISNIPIAAGLASSASGFAAIVLALNQFFNWQLTERELSILARLGSGSASRSIWQGFVEWYAGNREDGMDSYAEPLLKTWPDLCIGLLILSTKEKYMSSREAMQCTVNTSPFYALWPQKAANDMSLIKEAINTQDFELLGKTAESNALAMHATMLSSWPPINYAVPETITTMHEIWKLRREGLDLYFTQDAGPN